MNYKLTTLLMLGIFSSLVSAQSLTGASPSRAKAIQLYTDGRFEEASAIYARLCEEQPANLGLAKDYMWSLWNAKQYAEAANVAAKIVEKHPKDLEATNLMARANTFIGNAPLAFEAYKKSIELNPDQIHVERTLGNMSVDARDFNGAIEYFQKIQKKHPEKMDIYPLLAKALFHDGRFAESAEAWKKVADSTTNVDYQYNYARALYYSGQIDAGLERLRTIGPDKDLYYWRAIDFLTDDALSTGDTSLAETILEQHLTELRPQDEPRYLKLANIYRLRGQSDKAIALLNRVLNVDPKNGEVLLFIADYYLELGKTREAEKGFKEVLKLNPYAQRALLGIAETRFDLNDKKAAVSYAAKARAQDPTDPLLILDESHYLYEMDHRKESKQMADEWLKHNTGTVLPILLYHGLTPFKRDPLLAYSVHLTTAAFEEHIRALKMAGYTPVSIPEVNDWLHGKGTFPAHPVLITFDDARLDSFIYGDPILEKYNFKATMFAALINVEGLHPPAYCPWDRMVNFAKSGRWEIQSHGDLAHIHIPIDENGHQGLFLVNRKWLANEKSFETLPEWRARIEEDHKSAKKKIAQYLGMSPVGYSFPEGAYGETDSSNDPDAAPINLELARNVYDLGVIQDRSGMNMQSRDPIRLKRIEPVQTWTGDDLIRHIKNHDPVTLMYQWRLRQASWDGHIHEAYTWHMKMQQRGATPEMLFSEKARILLAAGDFDGARTQAQNAYAIQPSTDLFKFMQSIEDQNRAQWSPSFLYENDSQNRTNYYFDQILQSRSSSHTIWNVSHHFHELKESSFPNVQDNGGGAGLSHQLTPFQTLSAQADGHFLSHGKNTFSMTGSAHSEWSDNFTTELYGGRSLYNTAPAVENNILEHALGLRLGCGSDGPWRGNIKGKAAALTDGNRRAETELEAARRITARIDNLRAVYRFTFDTMKFVSPDYYSPQHLLQNQLGLEFMTNPSQSNGLGLSVRYLPGYGTEGSAKSEFVQDVEARIPWRLSKQAILTATGAFTQTPSYRRHTVGGEFEYRF